MSTTANRILVSSNDPQLLLSRQMVLKHAGFMVNAVGKEIPVASIPRVPPVGLIVLGHSLSREQQDELVKETRKRWPATKILRLIVGNDTMEQISADEYVYSSIDPGKLINICHQILSEKPCADETQVDL